MTSLHRPPRPVAGWLAAALLLAGCASTPPPGALSGRLVVNVAAIAGQPARSVSGSFDLQGDAERGELRLSSPLGTLVAAARWAPGEVLLLTGGEERRFDDLDSLSREALGEALPLRALPDWLRGRPWSGAASTPSDDGFEQLGWRVRTARLADGYVEAARPAPPAVSVRARLEPAT